MDACKEKEKSITEAADAVLCYDMLLGKYRTAYQKNTRDHKRSRVLFILLYGSQAAAQDPFASFQILRCIDAPQVIAVTGKISFHPHALPHH